MYTARQKNKIPHYSLQQTSADGNPLFEIREIPPGLRRSADFYVPHRKDYYYFLLVNQGSNRHWIDFINYDIQPRHLYFTLPGQVHLKEQNASIGATLLAFSEEFLLTGDSALKKLPILQNPDARQSLALSDGDIQFFNNLFAQMLAEYGQDADWKNGMLQSWLKIFLVYCSRLYTQQFNISPAFTDGGTLLRRLKELLDEKYDNCHQVSDYAQQLNVTPGHLNDMVRQHTGRTATTLIHDRVILEAKRALFHAELSVKEIGYSLGFGDAAYFNRFFKRLTGETPAGFRQAIREKYH